MSSSREDALLGYLRAIANDAKVRQAVDALSGRGLYRAVLDCVAEDFPNVWKRVRENGLLIAEHVVVPVVREASARAAGEFAERLATGIVKGIGDAIRGKK